MLSANREGFTPFFPIWMPLIYFTCLIALARTSGTMLNRSGKIEYPYFVPHLRGKASSLSPLSKMLVVRFAKLLTPPC